jgi:hypothetical protein
VITYQVPSGFTAAIANSAAVRLVSASQLEQIQFVIDPALEDTSSALATVAIGGETGYVLANGASADGSIYRMVIVVMHAGTQYELSCIGYRGYSRALLVNGCTSFQSTLRFAG